jgi:hypothetical protein
MNPELLTIVEGIRSADSRALAHFKLGRQTTPEMIIGRLGPPDNSWDDGVDCWLAYSTPIGTLSFMFAHLFAHYRFFFGRPRQMLTSIEWDKTERDQSRSTGSQ